MATLSTLRRRAGTAVAAAIPAWVLCYPTLVSPHAATTNTVLFDREIVRILDEHCVMCHRAGGAALPIVTYEDTWLRRAAIYDQVLARHMPPWAAVAGYGDFANANRLTLREQRFIVSWVEGLGPRNTGTVFLNVLDPDAAPTQEIAARTDFDAWRLGEPDAVVSLGTLAVTTDTPRSRVRRTVLDAGIDSARRLAALEYRPADRGALRAVVFSLASSGQWFATWTPWYGYRQLPPGTAYSLDAGAKIAIDAYTLEPNPDPIALGELGLHFTADLDGAAPADSVLVAAAEIPAASHGFLLHAEMGLERDVTVLALWPELPAGTESLELVARHPNGKVEILLLAHDIPLEWPTPYLYETPRVLPGGTALSLTARVSNVEPVAASAELRLTVSAAEATITQVR